MELSIKEEMEMLKIDRDNLNNILDNIQKNNIEKKQLNEIMCDYICDYKIDGEDIDVIRNFVKYLKQI